MPNPNDPLGFDVYARNDIDRGGRSSSGAELATNAILHRITEGVLPLVDSESGFVDFGDDVRRWIGLGLTQEGLDARAAALGPIIERDERVRSADVTGTLAPGPSSAWAFQINVAAQLRTGETISLAIGVSDVSVQLLSEGR